MQQYLIKITKKEADLTSNNCTLVKGHLTQQFLSVAGCRPHPHSYSLISRHFPHKPPLPGEGVCEMLFIY